jgi:hypothetical protein
MDTLLVLGITVKTFIKLKTENSPMFMQASTTNPRTRYIFVGENFGGIIRVFVGAAGKTNSDSLPPIGD